MTRVLAPSARPFIAYEVPPEQRQVTRSPAARDAFRDVVSFAEHCTKWLGPDRPNLGLSVYGLGDVDDNERAERLEAARRRATARFGPSLLLPGETLQTREGPVVVPDVWQWVEPLARADAALDWLEEFPDCVGDEWQRGSVHIGCTAYFWLRDLASRKLLPRQSSLHRAPVLWHSSLWVILQARSTIVLTLVLPFEEPGHPAREYVASLRPHLPVAFDPTAFWHYVPRADRSKYDKRQIPPDWLD